ncbi:Tetrathionate reductase subunit C [Pseudovibrio sp. Ad46]|uniref:NrfD/PsrC family molybdoenzyme membrane anchor subunit n=1 Tax=Pseudovibrio sp. Ad46 TaxID=989432 RepID=UPI0007AE8C27|nr:NrfD/PsrC family molybdoenzyme membrane anchor subunit [Pseudovibrio sp. Ad46]KZK90568.1 Tetrathionate reductase subunit C [Pseudovibrio sp. Ad46]
MPAVDLMSFDHEAVWRPWAVAYFLLVGTGAGAALLLAYARLVRVAEAKGALIVATSFALASGLPLLADLHQPARFMHFYSGAAPGSIMWWGSWFLPLFIASTLLLAFMTGRRGNAPMCCGERMLTMVVGALALCILGYTAGEMSVVAARPVWNTFGFPVVLILTALMSGAGATMTIDSLNGEKGDGRYMLVVTGAATLVAFGLWMLTDTNLSTLAADYAPVGLFGAFIIAGVVVPVVLAVSAKASLLLRGVSGALAVFGALAFRWSTFNGAQLMSKTETAFYGHEAALSQDALRTLAGSAGLLILSLIFVTLLINLLAVRASKQTQA